MGGTHSRQYRFSVWLACGASEPGPRFVLSCSFPEDCGRLLRMGQSVKAQTKHKGFGLRNGKPPGYLFVASSEVSAHDYVTSGSYHYVLNRAAR